MKAAEQVVHLFGRAAPIDDPVVLGQPMRVGRGGIVLGRFDRAAGGQGIGGPDRAGGAQRRRGAPRRPRSRSTSSLVSSGPIARWTFAIIAPASSALTTRMIVTPVSRSPPMIARRTRRA